MAFYAQGDGIAAIGPKGDSIGKFFLTESWGSFSSGKTCNSFDGFLAGLLDVHKSPQGMTREQAVKDAGEDAVAHLETRELEFDHADFNTRNVWFSASIVHEDESGLPMLLTLRVPVPERDISHYGSCADLVFGNYMGDARYEVE